MSGDHYLQAALMGRWGAPCNEDLRYRPICVRMKRPAKLFPTVPDAVAKENQLYPKWLEKIWHSYEVDLPRVAAALERGQITTDDASFLLLHVAALKPRSTSFLDYLNDYQRRYSLPLADATTLSLERVLSLLATVSYAQMWRWRVLQPPTGKNFIINDCGLCEFSDYDRRTGEDWPGRGVFFPLGPTVGILGFPYREDLHRRLFQPLDFSERFTLNRGYTALLNRHLWDEAGRLVIARPDDEVLLNSIDSGEQIVLDPSGPYRFRRSGFFSD
jgi:hypothetical protein